MATALSVITDREEYSRFEPGRSVVKARVLVTPAVDVAETITVELRRKGGIVLATQNLALSGDYPKGVVVEFALADIFTADGFPAIIAGVYTIVASDANQAHTASASFTVSLITVDEIKSGYCRGMQLYARDLMAPKKQPSLVTGVTIKTVSSSTPAGLYILSYTAAVPAPVPPATTPAAAPAKLRWNNGVVVELAEGMSTEILPDADGGYIEVAIDGFELPATSATEGILIDQETMNDSTIRSEIQRAASELERMLDTPLEPVRIATEPFFSAPETGEYYDRRAQPAAFYRRDVFNIQSKAWHVSMPYQYLQKVERLEGYVGETKSLDVSQGSFKCNVRQGIVEVLPASASYTYFLTFFCQLDYWGIREYIADFWRYTAVIGIRDMEHDLLKAIGLMAAIPILTNAGLAARGGYQSISISKDGVSQSSSVPKGMYSAAVDEYKEWLKDNRQLLVSRYRGMTMVTM